MNRIVVIVVVLFALCVGFCFGFRCGAQYILKQPAVRVCYQLGGNYILESLSQTDQHRLLCYTQCAPSSDNCTRG